MGNQKPSRPATRKFTEFKLDKRDPRQSPEFAAILKDLEGQPSILHLLRFYQKKLEKDASPRNPYLAKLAWLFRHGQAIDLSGHYYGITLVLKQGDYPFGGTLNLLWGQTVGPVSPWAGKTFKPATKATLTRDTEGVEAGKLPTFRGINCFNRVARSFWNTAGIEFMTFWVGLKKAPPSEQKRYGYERKGGFFIARAAESVDPANAGKKVLQLNYRWPKLGNPPPLSFLIDEMVEIADGLYLGQLLFAGDILKEYKPDRPSSHYNYANWGYFLLMDGAWHRKGEKA
jgi:hypothetical protein